ncbi:MAG: phosphate/phosphite/phosphonate ABC transporter substrate-binding protein [Betaproteobacteria bacterium]|nr:phosphate/phosphite/phosphonate ABC transporter substrate-binding protein [Betaproteobacteria bacterium]
MARLRLSMALEVNEITEPIHHGAVAVQGIELLNSDVASGELIWRQLRFAEFDVAQMSLPSLFILADRGASPWVALPIFPQRLFWHTRIVVRADSQLSHPRELKGRQIGVPEYMMTGAVWMRGIFRDEFGLAPEDLTWHEERPDERNIGAAFGYRPPPSVSVQRVPPHKSVITMLLVGEIDAACILIPTTTLLDRSQPELQRSGGVRPLFPDPVAESLRLYRKTGLYPINHCIAVRRTVFEEHGWVALNLYHAFLEAKERVVEKTRALLDPFLRLGMLPHEGASGIAGDPCPFGLKHNRKTLETMARYCHEQGLTSRQLALDEIFACNTLNL